VNLGEGSDIVTVQSIVSLRGGRS